MPYSAEAKQDILNSVYEQMAEGKGLVEICYSDDMPSRSTVNLWIIDDTQSDRYARAREARADGIFEEILSIADDITATPEDRRIAIDARKWAAGKLNGKYSDKMKHVGGDAGDAPIRTEVVKLERTIIDPQHRDTA
jgi:hypothetical protein